MPVTRSRASCLWELPTGSMVAVIQTDLTDAFMYQLGHISGSFEFGPSKSTTLSVHG